MIGQRAARNSIHPRPETLRITEVADARLNSQEDVLQDVVDLRGIGEAASHERTELSL
jgi:hypothetical protein